jgi:hypothetical protein
MPKEMPTRQARQLRTLSMPSGIGRRLVPARPPRCVEDRRAAFAPAGRLTVGLHDTSTVDRQGRKRMSVPSRRSSPRVGSKGRAAHDRHADARRERLASCRQRRLAFEAEERGAARRAAFAVLTGHSSARRRDAELGLAGGVCALLRIAATRAAVAGVGRRSACHVCFPFGAATFGWVLALALDALIHHGCRGHVATFRVFMIGPRRA